MAGAATCHRNHGSIIGLQIGVLRKLQASTHVAQGAAVRDKQRSKSAVAMECVAGKWRYSFLIQPQASLMQRLGQRIDEAAPLHCTAAASYVHDKLHRFTHFPCASAC